MSVASSAHEELRQLRAALRALGHEIDDVPPLPPKHVGRGALARMMQAPTAIAVDDLLSVMISRLPEIVRDAERERRPLASTIFACFNAHADSGQRAIRYALGWRPENEIRLSIRHGLAWARAAGAPWTFHATGSDPQYMRTLLSFVNDERQRRDVERWCARTAPPGHIHVALVAGDRVRTQWLELVRDAATRLVVAVRLPSPASAQS